MENNELIKYAINALSMSYSPYSEYKVGAALLTKSGKVYTGCNIENSSYGATNCAERTAFFKAISEGEREFDSIAIVAEKDGVFCSAPPCGICRQVMSEFCDNDFRIIISTSDNNYDEFRLSELLPNAFLKNNLLY